jgi:hypothetical protein
MAKASDNVFPKLIVSEGTTPSSPATGQQKLFIDSADHKVKRVNSAGVVTTVEGGAGGGTTYSSYDDAVSSILTGVVHRWKFDETSGTTVADAVGSLPLTLAGTYTRNITSKTGVATNFVSATATATGSGSVPTGNNPRCFIALLRSTSLAEQAVFSYGTPNSTNRIWMTGVIGSQNDTPNATTPGGGLYTWGDDMGNVGMGQSVRGNEWHLMAWGYDGNKGATVMIDGVSMSGLYGANLATASATNFQIGKSSYSGHVIPLLGDIDDFLVMDNWPGIAKLRKFHRALQDFM